MALLIFCVCSFLIAATILFGVAFAFWEKKSKEREAIERERTKEESAR